MQNMLAEIKEKVSQLSENEKAELALSLIESLDGPPIQTLRRNGGSKLNVALPK